MINFAILGLGRIGKIHVANIASDPKCNIECIYDIDNSISLEISKKYGCKVSSSAENVNKFIKHWQNKLSISNEKTILIGFSQGSMLSLEIGTNILFGGLLCYSGSFIKNNRPLTKKHKIMLIHGELDEVIPIQSMENAKSTLENLGATVHSYISKNLGHSIDQDGINKGIEFIKKCNK